jgi:hypothetical protein
MVSAAARRSGACPGLTALLTPSAAGLVDRARPRQSQDDRRLTAWKIPLSTTAGIESRNENLAAVGRSRPRNRPAEIVAPDLDTPGTSASVCAEPITTASRSPRSVIRRSLRPVRSATSRTRPNRISVAPIKVRLRASRSIRDSKASPSTAIGIVARMRYHPSLASSVAGGSRPISDRAQAEPIRARSRRK